MEEGLDQRGEQAALDLLTKGWDGFFAGHGRALLEEALPAWMARQRWFGAKTRKIASLSLGRWAELPIAEASTIALGAVLPVASSLGDVLLLVDLLYTDGSADRYQVPLAFTSGAGLAELAARSPASVITQVTTPTGDAAFYDAVAGEEFRQALLRVVQDETSLPLEDEVSAAEHVAATLVAAHESRPAHEVPASETRGIAEAIQARHSIEPAEVAPEFIGHMAGAAAGESTFGPLHGRTSAVISGSRSDLFAQERGTTALTTRVNSAEQSNTNIVYGRHMLLKLFRRLQPGLNPDVELGRFLTETARFPAIAPFLGEIGLSDEAGETTTLAMLQGLVANEGDGWEWTLRELAQLFAGSVKAAGAPGAELAYAQAAGLLGRRTAGMHLALATQTADAAFAAEPLSMSDLGSEVIRIRQQVTTALDALLAGSRELDGETAANARAVLARRDDLLRRADVGSGEVFSGMRIRIHGDYHLGQILRTQDDFVILDFEGEPARTLEERRRKQSPLKDVAGMLRSFSYAAHSGLDAAGPAQRATLLPFAQAWEARVSQSFLEGYEGVARTSAQLLPGKEQAEKLLNAYLLEKALYELLYELNNRPAWVGIPLAGILALS